MAYDNTNFYGDLIVNEYDDKGNFMTPRTPTGYYVYHILGDGFDLMSEMCNQFMNDYSILTASPKSLDNFWGVSYNMPRPSLPYLYNLILEDVGTTTNHNDIWILSNATLTRDTSGSTLLETTATGYVMNNSYNTIPSDSVVEFDICQTDGTSNYATIYIRNDRGGISLASINYDNLGASIGDWVHLKIVFNNTDTITVYSDKLSEPFTKTLSATSPNYRMMLYCGGDTTTIKFKNFKIYGIVYPNIYFDDATTDTNSRYYINTGGGTSLTWNNGYLVLTLGSRSRYVRLRTSQYDVNNLIGKKIHFEAEIDADTEAYVQLLDDSTGNVYRRANGNEITRGVSQLEYTIPSNCTEVLFQIIAKDQSGSGGTIKFKNFKIYDMENPIYSTRLMTDEEYKIYLYLRNCRLMTREDIEINMNKCFAIEGQNIFFTTETNYLSAVSHLDYISRDTGTSNIAKNLEDDTLNFITDFEGDEETLTFESGLSVVEEVVEVVNVPANNYDPAFLELLEKYISVKGNLKIKEYSI